MRMVTVDGAGFDLMVVGLEAMYNGIANALKVEGIPAEAREILIEARGTASACFKKPITPPTK